MCFFLVAVLYADTLFSAVKRKLSSLIVKQRIPVTFQSDFPVYERRHKRGTLSILIIMSNNVQ